MTHQSGYTFIVIAGNIGSGKTTLSKMLAQHFNWSAHFESVDDNPYLQDFYSDMPRWSFPLQVHFLTHRYQTHRAITSSSASSVQDRSIYEDANIFARSLYEQDKMDKRDYENYLKLFRTMTEELKPPTLLVYLRRSVPLLKERIRLRGRDYEKNIPDSYLEKLNFYYEDWFHNYKGGKTLLIDTDQRDFIGSSADFQDLVHQIINSLDQKDFYYDMNGMTSNEKTLLN